MLYYSNQQDQVYIIYSSSFGLTGIIARRSVLRKDVLFHTFLEAFKILITRSMKEEVFDKIMGFCSIRTNRLSLFSSYLIIRPFFGINVI